MRSRHIHSPRIQHNSAENDFPHKILDTELTYLDVRELEIGEFLTVYTQNDGVYVLQIVSKSQKGEMFVKILFGQNTFKFEYAGIQNIFLTGNQPLVLDSKQGKCASTSGFHKVVVTKSYPDLLRLWEIEQQKSSNETIPYNVETDDVKVKLLQIGDFIHIKTQDGLTYLLLVIDVNINNKRIVRVVSSNNPNIKTTINRRIINNLLKIGTPLFLEHIEGGSSPVTSIKITKVNFKDYGKEEPKKEEPKEETSPPKEETVNPNAPAFNDEEIEALKLLGIGDSKPQTLTEKTLRVAFRKLATKWHSDKKEEDAEIFVRTRVMQMLGDARDLLLRRFN
jgi:hypothetical protein